MRIALIGDFDTFVCRGLERPQELLPYRLEPGLNLLRGFREIGLSDVHMVVVTSEVRQPTVDEGPLGVLHRLPCPPLSGSASFFLWRRHLILAELKKIQPDIVHGQGTESAPAFTAVTSPYPNVITIHGIMHRVQKVVRPPLLSLSHVPRWIEKLVVQKATDVICLSGEVERFLRERHSPARCHRIPNAVTPCFFSVKTEPRDSHAYSLLFVGTIYPLKGLIHLVEALLLVQNKVGASVRLRVIGPKGGGPVAADYIRHIQSRARDSGLDGQIDWLGVQSAENVANALSQADLLVLPSLQETAPMCVAEAMAAGVPVVASRVGGIPDLVDDAVNGLLVSPQQTGELAEAIAELLTDETRRIRMGQAGREKARATYTPRRVAERTLAVYENIVQRKV
jgi:glycosyltransferase involved in cell wall biosynthesis